MEAERPYQGRALCGRPGWGRGAEAGGLDTPPLEPQVDGEGRRGCGKLQGRPLTRGTWPGRCPAAWGSWHFSVHAKPILPSSWHLQEMKEQTNNNNNTQGSLDTSSKSGRKSCITNCIWKMYVLYFLILFFFFPRQITLNYKGDISGFLCTSRTYCIKKLTIKKNLLPICYKLKKKFVS